MTSIRALLANTIGSIRHGDLGPTNTEYADALLASPQLDQILELAEWATHQFTAPYLIGREEAAALLADWREQRLSS